jgi:cytochrome c oxidase subunit 2
MLRRAWLRLVVNGTLTAALAGAARRAGGQPPRRIAIQAMKFGFLPAEVTVTKGEPVTLVLSKADFPHGFALPDFNLRRDLVPGADVELTLTPHNAGRFHMLCDNFCGEGHDRMSGWFVVASG